MWLHTGQELSTLSRHLSAWKRWCEFARALGIVPSRPSPAALLDFARALSEGAACDRGCGRVCKAKGVIGSLRFVAGKLGFELLRCSIEHPAISAWVTSDKWLRATQRALLDATDEAWLIGCILLI